MAHVLGENAPPKQWMHRRDHKKSQAPLGTRGGEKSCGGVKKLGREKKSLRRYRSWKKGVQDVLTHSSTLVELPQTNPHCDLQFSRAAEEDFEEILSISKDIYGGLDYLPSRYGAWLQDPHRMVILARKQGKVIALQSVCVIDDGQTALVEGLRVAPQERGKGVARVLLKFCSQMVKSRYPSVKVSRLTRDDPLGPRDLQKYQLIAKQGILLFEFQAEKLRQRLADLGSELGTVQMDRPVRLESEELQRLLLNEDVARDILPNGTIVQDWQPFRLLPGNVQMLLQREVDWMADDMLRPTVLSLCSAPFLVPLSLGCHCLTIDIFGRVLEPVQQQVLAHLEHSTHSLTGRVVCQMFLAPPLWELLANFCCGTLGAELVQGYSEQYVVEADLV
ncbi:histidine N-acetyltransferase-like isoform X1 [Paramormyrops kingsleyae]|uniref:histidine N-acetyltransferase-like isoform X1 n=1 Tax=Paramormyrops kingsleyae TaxID=1676925 RepID=UPI000CD5D766|nr:histidine N-acetyltransferase-like isoform X1 [Paramormyrops kingsleyae]XP_023685020.1 histidine N-acetyltransferase-like isoform X1 [Paramormyrops kingsleyae]